GDAGCDRGSELDAPAVPQPAGHLCRSFLWRTGARAACKQHRGLACAAGRRTGRLLEVDGLAGALSRVCHAQSSRYPPHATSRLCARLERSWRGLAERRVLAVGSLGEQPALPVRRRIAEWTWEFSEVQGRNARALSFR